MAELKRLLISPTRLIETRFLLLNRDESHYLKRVLRLRTGDSLAITDGCGHLWEGSLVNKQRVMIHTQSCEHQHNLRPTLGVAVSVIRHGFDDVVRMTCELGIDVIQPLQCERSVPHAEYRPERWDNILREAVEQCERLWCPKIAQLSSLETWLAKTTGQIAVGVTRSHDVLALGDWLVREADPFQTIWLILGPEGGWTEAEQESFTVHSASLVHLGPFILRSSTAAIAGAVELVRWRELQINS
ncbi:16S rRNA (uracil(1498)-N(3))-methyltransferase [Synechococcus sp. M16CYN]|uniref:16S rRNA (uracil(1498)-N(3))-methyltransferase n=1 Tax=Synechococcus sp. M16CYN TaxID=3103139 RepID=UPI00324D8931